MPSWRLWEASIWNPTRNTEETDQTLKWRGGVEPGVATENKFVFHVNWVSRQFLFPGWHHPVIALYLLSFINIQNVTIFFQPSTFFLNIYIPMLAEPEVSLPGIVISLSLWLLQFLVDWQEVATDLKPFSITCSSPFSRGSSSEVPAYFFVEHLHQQLFSLINFIWQTEANLDPCRRDSKTVCFYHSFSFVKWKAFSSKSSSFQ